MTDALAVDPLVKALHQPWASLPDDRKGKHTPYAIKDAALGAFAVFLTQAPACLASQRTMQQAKGRRHAERLWGMVDSPCDHQLRTWLDPVAPAQLLPLLAMG